MFEQVVVKLESSKIVVWMMLSNEEKIHEEVEPYIEELWLISRLLISSQEFL